MAGLPTRISRDDLGPKLENWAEVKNSKREIGCDTFNLAFNVVAASAQSGPLGWGLISSTGAKLAIGEAWNTNASPALHPTVTHPSTGVYIITYTAQVPDFDGVLVTLALRSGRAFPQTTGLIANVAVSVNRVATVTVTRASNATLLDSVFEFEVR